MPQPLVAVVAVKVWAGMGVAAVPACDQLGLMSGWH